MAKAEEVDQYKGKVQSEGHRNTSGINIMSWKEYKIKVNDWGYFGPHRKKK